MTDRDPQLNEDVYVDPVTDEVFRVLILPPKLNENTEEEPLREYVIGDRGTVKRIAEGTSIEIKHNGSQQNPSVRLHVTRNGKRVRINRAVARIMLHTFLGPPHGYNAQQAEWAVWRWVEGADPGDGLHIDSIKWDDQHRKGVGPKAVGKASGQRRMTQYQKNWVVQTWMMTPRKPGPDDNERLLNQIVANIGFTKKTVLALLKKRGLSKDRPEQAMSLEECKAYCGQ